MKNHLYLFFLVFVACHKPGVAPEALLPLPTQAQIDYQEMEINGFVHFNMNTFTNMEWGYGDESPSTFNPSELDTKQWVSIMKKAGMKGVIITAKHHDGFCLWPSEFTEHSVKHSPWKNGKGDIIKELREACDEYGLKLGIYLSPWDRNHPDYGKAEYITYFRNQLKELLSNYGEIFEVWFDGANGGDGYYGGANENRKVDKLTYYDWENTYKLVYELQPNAIIFSDAGPGCRWIGNEHGFAYPSTWSMLLRDSVYTGMPEYGKKYASGQENGTHWVPGESDVSIRPGWYYHEYEDHKVKSLAALMDIYYKSVGQNSTLLLNFPVDKRGLIHEKDEEQVLKMAAKIKEDFTSNLALSKPANCSSCRGSLFTGQNATDGDPDTYWALKDQDTIGSITIDFEEEMTFNRIVLQEPISLGQRISKFKVEVFQDKEWRELANETTIGYKRILRTQTVSARKIKVSILDARACPAISEIGIYYAPPILTAPSISRSRYGQIAMNIPEQGPTIHYTSDGSLPSAKSKIFEKRINFSRDIVLKAVAIYGDQVSEVTTLDVDIAPGRWKVLNANRESLSAIDGNADTWWAGNELIIHFQENLRLKGFTYLPTQQRYPTGFIKKYEVYTSLDGKKWQLSARGEFPNILNSPITQRKEFELTEAAYMKIKATETLDGQPASFAELGVITK